MKHQVYISSYRKDAEWLRHCLFSLNKFQSGFLPPVVGVADEDFGLIESIIADVCPSADVVARGEPTWMGAQIRMMEADLLCPDADVIYFLGSDCIAFDTFKPEPYCDADGRPIVLYTPYEYLKGQQAGIQRTSLADKWRSGTERVLGMPVNHEFMRRIPSVYPRSIFGKMRSYVEALHHQPFAEYITQADAKHKNTSEANILGAYAFKFMPQTCCWVDTSNYTPEAYPSAILHMWSWGGLDRPTAAPEDPLVILRDGLPNYGRTAREIIQKMLYS